MIFVKDVYDFLKRPVCLFRGSDFLLNFAALRRSLYYICRTALYGIIILTINKTVMKRLNLYLSLLLAALIGVNFSSCSNDDGNETGGNGTGKDTTEIQVDTATVVFIGDSTVLSAEEMLDKLYGVQGVEAADHDTLRKTFMAKIEERKQQVARELKAKYGDTTNVSGISMGFVTYTYRYWSRDRWETRC